MGSFIEEVKELEDNVNIHVYSNNYITLETPFAEFFYEDNKGVTVSFDEEISLGQLAIAAKIGEIMEEYKKTFDKII